MSLHRSVASARGGLAGWRHCASANRWPDRGALERWQQRRLKSHIAWVRARSPFYRAHWADRGIAEWSTVPVIDKATMMANFATLNTVGITAEEGFAVAHRAYTSRDFRAMLGDVAVGMSSGTSGTLGLFLSSPWERGFWAGAILAKLLPRPLHLPVRIALILRANNQLYESLSTGPLGFRYFDLTRPVGELARDLTSYAPTVLVGPPSVLSLLLSEGLQVRPRRVFAVAEVLDAAVASQLAEEFGQSPYQIYQATEGFLGASCRQGTLHLNEDLVMVEREVIDVTSGRFIPVVTDLFRQSQPIVRYRLNDVLVPRSAPCSCGSILASIERVEGRTDDVWSFPSRGGGTAPVYPDMVSFAIAGAHPAIRDYRADQIGEREVAVRIEVRAGALAADQTAIAAAVAGSLERLAGARNAGEIVVRVTFDLTPGRADGKLRRVQRLWKPGH